ALLAAQLRERAMDAREHATRSGLRLDQAATVWHVLTSARAVEVVTGPAGTGKTRILAAAARAWGGPVFGTATSQNAANELRKAGVRVTANTTRLLANLDTIPPGSLIVVDEGSMVSLAQLAALTEYAARNGCKLVLAGDQEQLAAVEGGGAMKLLADRIGYVQLAEPVRFTAAWERAASLRLRRGDATALDDYDQHGGIRGAPPDQATDQAVHAYVASYLAGQDILLMAADWARCRELSQRIRDDPGPPRPGRCRPRRAHRRRRRSLGRGSDHLPSQRPRARGGRARPGPGQRGHPADRGHHQQRPDGPKAADPQPGTRAAPELDRYERIRRERAGFLPIQPAPGPGSPDPREPIAVLADVLDRDGTGQSGSETRRRNLANADHLGILNAIWTAETRGARDDRYRGLVMSALPAGHRQPLSHQARWLFRTLHAAELAGLDPAEVTRTAIAASDLAGARDIASVLDARIRPRVNPLLPQPQGPWAERVPQLLDLEHRAYLAEIAAMMDDRMRVARRFRLL
ncbi:MAG: DUF4350 domain-containing protein, partial [Streptosporangiaceae bacterium]